MGVTRYHRSTRGAPLRSCRTRPFVRYSGLSKEEWLASPEGQAWLEKKMQRQSNRPDPAYPFATINGRPCIVWGGEIEYEDDFYAHVPPCDHIVHHNMPCMATERLLTARRSL